MISEVLLERPHIGVPWGFRIIGGSDSHLPIIVSKVLENSIAEKGGLEEDVLIERINDIPTYGLTHSEVNEIILSADCQLLFSIRRENLENLILASLNNGDNNNSEINDILRGAVLANSECEFVQDIQQNMTIINRPTEEINTSNQSHISSDKPKGEKKWSTFLQKPSNPKPKPKNETSIPKQDRYRVIIKKQPKKEKKLEERDTTNMNNQQEHIEQEEIIQEPNEYEVEDQQEITEEVEEHENEEVVGEEEIETIENIEIVPDEVCEQVLQTDEEVAEPEVVLEEPPSLEKQLAAVQKQLEELAQLPSTIQETLAVVTQKLATLVGERKESHEEVDKQDDKPIGDQSDENKVECAEEEEDVAEYMSETAEMEGPQSEILSDICEEQEIPDIAEEEPQESTADEEEDEEKIRLQEEIAAKQQLGILDEDDVKTKKSTVRPIILPGGRKWVDPDDAVTSVKNPKMSDEKICSTLENFSEVIVGKTKGINFLKYTTPPKNLDYLQRSDVYRLIHGMEPPVKGISLRSGKVLAEEDYYTPGDN